MGDLGEEIRWEIAEKSDEISDLVVVVVIGDKFGEKKMVVMEPDMQHRMPWYDRYEASSGNFCQQCNVILGDFFKIQISNQH